MKATELIEATLEMSRSGLLGLLGDLQEGSVEEVAKQTGRHPLWLLGHTIHSEAGLVNGFILGEGANPLAKWDTLFGRGSAPDPSGSGYPSMQELVAEWEIVRKRTVQTLRSLSDADLSKASHAPADRAAMFGTVGQCFAMISHHAAFHAGQVADLRRAMGRGPVFA